MLLTSKHSPSLASSIVFIIKYFLYSKRFLFFLLIFSGSSLWVVNDCVTCSSQMLFSSRWEICHQGLCWYSWKASGIWLRWEEFLALNFEQKVCQMSYYRPSTGHLQWPSSVIITSHNTELGSSTMNVLMFMIGLWTARSHYTMDRSLLVFTATLWKKVMLIASFRYLLELHQL